MFVSHGCLYLYVYAYILPSSVYRQDLEAVTLQQQSAHLVPRSQFSDTIHQKKKKKKKKRERERDPCRNSYSIPKAKKLQVEPGISQSNRNAQKCSNEHRIQYDGTPSRQVGRNLHLKLNNDINGYAPQNKISIHVSRFTLINI